MDAGKNIRVQIRPGMSHISNYPWQSASPMLAGNGYINSIVSTRTNNHIWFIPVTGMTTENKMGRTVDISITFISTMIFLLLYIFLFPHINVYHIVFQWLIHSIFTSLIGMGMYVTVEMIWSSLPKCWQTVLHACYRHVM